MNFREHDLIDLPLTLRLSFGGHETKLVPLHYLPCPGIVRPLAQALLRSTKGSGPIKTLRTALHYKDAIARFVRWLDGVGFQGDLGDLTKDHLYDYAGQERRRYERNLRALLKVALEHEKSSELRTHLSGKLISARPPRAVPLTPYSRSEYEQLAAACKSEIETFEKDCVAARCISRLSPNGPPSHVALAFRILIGFETGLPSEGLDHLTLEGLRWQGDRELRIEYLKRRAHGVEARNYRSSGRWSAPELVRRWLELTEPLRNAMGEPPEFWICARRNGEGRTPTFSDASLRNARLGLIRKHDVRGDDGELLRLDLRRLRTTYMARRQRAWNGAVTIDPNHSPQVEGDHYLTASADPDEVASIVVEAQGDLLRKAHLVSIVVADDDALADLVDLTDVSTDPVERSTSRDMFAALCSNPFRSPFSPVGDFCTAAVWTCIVCPLAIVTEAKLPALMSLEAFLSEQCASVSSEEWLRFYAPAWVQLKTRIFPAFSTEALARAQSRLDHDGHLPIPIRLGEVM